MNRYMPDVAELFNDSTGAVAVTVRRLRRPRVLWMNRREAEISPVFKQLGFNQFAFEQHLLQCCAFVIDDGSVDETLLSEDTMTAYCDRYGGSGIGNNGGSGRAALVNGYYVKGVGRTPLISALTDPDHASGGAYLEESIRETIFSEIVNLEFPYSGVPTLAIIDTGIVQNWHSGERRTECRTLLIRPMFLRPAHFQRAAGFISPNLREGMHDAARVREMFRAAGELYSPLGFGQLYTAFWIKWAKQLAYSFVHRMPHGSNTISNVALDGRLSDFGASSAVPSWENVATMRRWHPFESIFADLASSMQVSFRSVEKYSAHSEAILETRDAILQLAHRAFVDTIIAETLRYFGVPRQKARSILNTTMRDSLWLTIAKIIQRLQLNRIDLLQRDNWASPYNRLNIWEDGTPPFLMSLRSLLGELLSEREQNAAKLRSSVLERERNLHNREQLREIIYRAVDHSERALKPTRQQVEEQIDRLVVAGRRDTRHDLPPDVQVIGFAYSGGLSYLIVENGRNLSQTVLREPSYGEQGIALRRICLVGKTNTSVTVLDIDAGTATAARAEWFRDQPTAN